MSTPDFIIIGAMKCATSTVTAYLEDHPGAFVPPGREPNFFSFEDRWAQGPEWYESLFDARAPGQVAGENTNNYANLDEYPEAPARLHATCPEAKLIYMVRHPVKRISSAWVQNRIDKGDTVPPTLDRAVAELHGRFVGQSLYWRNLQAYRALFPDERIFIGFMEDMQADQPAFMARVCDFLGIEHVEEVRRGHVNQSAGKKVPGKGFSALKSVPGLKTAVRALLPKSARAAARDRIFSREVKDLPGFSPEALAKLEAELKPDAAALLEFCGKPADFWRFET